MNKQGPNDQPYICTLEDQADIRFAQDALYVLSGKWRLSITIALHNGHRRYRDIARNVPGITFAMLSRELKLMEINNLVSRSEDPDFPKTVEYCLTDYSHSLYPIVESLVTWGKQHHAMIRTVG
ncbi:helix-turn-helix domain-containing protein [Hymenobacter sp. YC55]|uniref:winged helix-turn-helix transcriptional regulator n=1 Tax=Hymenobacter sp. YC55 TaxID=3034019 RepID=UPI0023F644D9|nr:helix-turn-helix domain-containing protein [Hymenobacter sp. YC55]MDF7814233.1 helix-turn-helix domain-containing protein [Hymenobacter sp. YC55]